MDLQRFCKRDGDFRMGAPFTQNGKTWATNGWLAIGVPERDDVPANELAPKMEKAHPTAEPPDVWYGVPIVDVQTCKHCGGKIRNCTCPECNGRGYVKFSNDYTNYTNDCDTCDGEGEIETCHFCQGTGYDSEKQTDIGGATFNNRALLLIMDLPGVQIAPTGKRSPAFIKFDGGVGYLMPANKIGAP